MDIGKYINDCLTEIFSTEEFAENFLIEVVITNSKFEVFLDGDDGVTLAKCRKISRLLEEKLEASESVPEKYVLEVSSPGAARPLTKWRQYRKHSGRELEVTLKDGAKLKGKLTEISDHMLVLSEKIKKETVTHEVPFDNIKESLVQISFN